MLWDAANAMVEPNGKLTTTPNATAVNHFLPNVSLLILYPLMSCMSWRAVALSGDIEVPPHAHQAIRKISVEVIG
jgi:hypothetical protein